MKKAVAYWFLGLGDPCLRGRRDARNILRCGHVYCWLWMRAWHVWEGRKDDSW